MGGRVRNPPLRTIISTFPHFDFAIEAEFGRDMLLLDLCSEYLLL